jgi:filamentous hemagglutinin family protein
MKHLSRSIASAPIDALSPAAPARFALKALALSLLAAFNPCAYALPTGGAVSAGDASIAAGANKTTITQSTPAVAINWQSFNIGQGEAVRFVQPTSSSVALNRVLGSDASSILGSLSANGKVFLVNPNGILFGTGAQVNVAGLVASTLNISDGDFMAGAYKFGGAGAGAVINRGAINAAGGYVALLGANVSNEGVITANLGTVALAAGNAMTLDMAGDGLLNVAVSQGAVNALVHNGGLIRAAGGQVLMSAQSAGNLLRTVVNNTGVIEAQTLENRNGTIRLVGDPQTGAVNVSGTLDVSGRAAGQTGGTVHVLGRAVNLAGAKIDASGDAGGGLVLVGGNFHGAGPERNSQTVGLDRSVVIRADAITAGNGGRIAVWSDGDTAIAGALSARGGAQSGNGGFIETSGARVSIADGTVVNTLAAKGNTGLWLLDPFPDYVIATVGGDETPAQVTLSLATTNRLITATRDVIVDNDLTWVTAQKLELRAGHDVQVNAVITASTAGSEIALTAANDVIVAGTLTASGAASKITIRAERDVTTSGTVTASANGALIDMSAGRHVSVGVVTANGGGSVSLRGNTDVIVNNLISVDTGLVTLRADNDGTGPGSAGGTVRFVGVGSVSAPNTVIRFNPDGYVNTTAEIANYVTKVNGAIDARAWTFARGVDKVYDGSAAATLAFRGNPGAGGVVTLDPGSASFDTKDVGTTKPVNYTGYSLGGVDVAKFALFSLQNVAAGSGTTTANITPAPLTITANNATKVYGQTATFATSAFTSVGLVNAETVGGVTETSPGTVASASVAGSTYPIIPSGATAGTFTPSNYAINYVNGTLAVTPAALTVTASDATKVFGSTTTLSGFTTAGLVNGETVGSITAVSPGTAASATVAGGPYPILASNAAGGSFTASDYTISYVGGALAVTPIVIPPGLPNVAAPVVIPPGLPNVAAPVVIPPGLPNVAAPVVIPPGLPNVSAPVSSTAAGSSAINATPPDMPTGTIPGVTSVGTGSPGTTYPSTTDPITTSPSTTVPGDSDIAYAASSVAYPVSSTATPVPGLNLRVAGAGVRMPAMQLARTSPAPAANATPAVAASTTPAAQLVPVVQPAPHVAPAPASRPRAVPLPRRPKNDRN